MQQLYSNQHFLLGCSNLDFIFSRGAISSFDFAGRFCWKSNRCIYGSQVSHPMDSHGIAVHSLPKAHLWTYVPHYHPSYPLYISVNFWRLIPTIRPTSPWDALRLAGRTPLPVPVRCGLLDGLMVGNFHGGEQDKSTYYTSYYELFYMCLSEICVYCVNKYVLHLKL